MTQMPSPAALLLAAVALVLAPAGSAAADELPPGLRSAELLAGHVTAQGTRMTALRLELEPGWKTYWRSPGDTGIPPRFDWEASENLASAVLLWPEPEVIQSGAERTLGYHDGLVLPVELTPQRMGEPVAARARVELGLCRDICVPALIEVEAPAAGSTPDPRIEAALARVPVPGTGSVTCTVADIADGVRVTARVAGAAAPPSAAAMEFAEESVWVSQPVLAQDGQAVTATADFVAPSGKPFPLDPGEVRLTLISPQGAADYRGCAEG